MIATKEENKTVHIIVYILTGYQNINFLVDLHYKACKV